jgi:hypothetical protein
MRPEHHDPPSLAPTATVLEKRIVQFGVRLD